ncbi:hypothetical protein LINPERHAP1_LOCUS15627 [Linum perenne]
MSSSRNQARGTRPTSNNQRAQFPSHFFRLIVDEKEHSRLLPLPKKFARHSRGTTATLQTPPGEQWTMDIICDNDGTKQFAGQWNDFYTFNSLKLADNETIKAVTGDTLHTNYPFFKLELSRCAATATEIMVKTVLLQHGRWSWKTKAYLQQKK